MTLLISGMRTKVEAKWRNLKTISSHFVSDIRHSF